MAGLILRRLLQALPTLLAAVLLVWLLLFLVPGDPCVTILGARATPEKVASCQAEWGLDRPPWVQFGVYLGRLLRGDLGTSVVQSRPVATILAEGLPRSLLLGGASLAVALPLGILLGVLAARHGGVVNSLVSGLTLAGLSVPTFWAAYLLMMLFAVKLRILPVSGYGEPAHLVLPAMTLAIYPVCLVARVTRAAFGEQMRAPHVTAARARGLESRSVVWRHAFRNALAPVVTVSGILTASFLGGAIATESVFAWPGLGRILFTAALGHDVMVVEGGVLLLTVLFIAANLAVDLAYSLLDPRTRQSES